MNYLCFSLLEVFPVMKFGELAIIGKDENGQNLNISIWFITIIYLLQFYFSFTVNMQIHYPEI